jgi:Protein of unknown function (DUF1203)
MTTTLSELTLTFRPLPAPIPDLDALPSAVVQNVVADSPGSYPCRRCLRDAEVGEELVLFPYDPFLGDSPYRQAGPIFVHVEDCRPEPHDLHQAPAQLLSRQLSLRGFDAQHRQIATAVVEGTDIEESAQRMLRRTDVEYLHVHNAGPGCFAVRVERVERVERGEQGDENDQGDHGE